MIPNIVLTEDGSITCEDANSGELYHNRVGAFTEALKHYVEICDLSGYLNRQSNIAVLDVCFGLGYNSFVLIDALRQYIENNDNVIRTIDCHIVGIEQNKKIFDLIPQVLSDYKFDQMRRFWQIDNERSKDMVRQWQNNGTVYLYSKKAIKLNINIEIKTEDLRKVVPQMVADQKQFDFVFHDGFSPRSMPELWTIDLFEQYARLITDHGRIITYSSAYAVRSALTKCGLEVRKTLPLGAKSGGTVAFKQGQSEITNEQSIFYLSDREKERLKGNSGVPYRDPLLNGQRKEIILRRDYEIRKLSANH